MLILFCTRKAVSSLPVLPIPFPALGNVRKAICISAPKYSQQICTSEEGTASLIDMAALRNARIKTLLKEKEHMFERL